VKCTLVYTTMRLALMPRRIKHYCVSVVVWNRICAPFLLLMCIICSFAHFQGEDGGFSFTLSQRLARNRRWPAAQFVQVRHRLSKKNRRCPTIGYQSFMGPTFHLPLQRADRRIGPQAWPHPVNAVSAAWGWLLEPALSSLSASAAARIGGVLGAAYRDQPAQAVLGAATEVSAGAGGRAEVGVVTSGSAGHHEAAQPGTVALPPQRAPLRCGLEAPPEPPRRPQVDTDAARRGAGLAAWRLSIQPFCVCCCAAWRGPPRRGIWGPTRTCMRSSEPHLGCSRFCGRAEVGVVTSGSAGQSRGRAAGNRGSAASARASPRGTRGAARAAA